MTTELVWRATPRPIGLVLRKVPEQDALFPLGRSPNALPRGNAVLVGPEGPEADLTEVEQQLAALEQAIADAVALYASIAGAAMIGTANGETVQSAIGGLPYNLYIATRVTDALSGFDMQHYAGQGGVSPIAAVWHDYTDAPRSLQIDKVGGDIGNGAYVLGLRRANNPTRRPDKNGTYIGNCGFLQCTYDKFTQTAAFTGSISGTVLTVTAMTSGALAVSQVIEGNGALEGTAISSFGTGTGGVGTYNLLVRSAATPQVVSSAALTGKTKTVVLGFYIGTNGGFGWAEDPAIMTCGYTGGLYAFQFTATGAAQYVASFASANGPVLNVQDAVASTRTDLIAPVGQTSGMRIEALGGGIDIAPLAGRPVTLRNAAKLPTYTVAGLPAVGSFYPDSIVVVSNGDAGNPCLALASGGTWKRVTIGATVSAT